MYKRLKTLVVVLEKNTKIFYHFTTNTAIFNMQGELLVEVRNNFIQTASKWCSDLNVLQAHLHINRQCDNGFMVAIGGRNDRNYGESLYKAVDIKKDNLKEFTLCKLRVCKHSNIIFNSWVTRYIDIFKNWTQEISIIPKSLFKLQNDYYTTQFIAYGFVAKPHVDHDINSYTVAYCIDRKEGIKGGDFIMNDYNISIEMRSKSIWLFNSDEYHATSELLSDTISTRNRMIGVLTCPKSLLYDYKNITVKDIDCEVKKLNKK
jgi:hypothetical protein